MIRDFGLSPALGPVGYGGTTPDYLGEQAQDPLAALLIEHETVDGDAVAVVLREEALLLPGVEAAAV
ncbi:hypothetical protein [Planobispora takensis]|uniref:Uncharacterized protein n=1 Tax=Planobispora takensis TaxID=1367882 RepID=A0A8J3T8E4_9ACTN|nr:hypothetical protein [Planobispora takensis]GII06003.1 hypothetical protein Pta02_80110 [Planobispora takensis]